MSQPQGTSRTLGMPPGHHDRGLELLDPITSENCTLSGVEQAVILQQGDCISGDLECGWRGSVVHVAMGFGDLELCGVGLEATSKSMYVIGGKCQDSHTMPSRDVLTASYRSGVRFVGLMLPAPPWMISRGLILSDLVEDGGCLYSMIPRS